MKCAKRLFALFVITLPILAAAQMQSDTTIVGQVPFSFVVGNRHVPAGKCTIEPATAGATMLLIRNVAAKVGLFAPATRKQTKTASASYALVFHKYGDRAFLTGIRLAGDRTMYQVPESEAETELRAQNITATEEILLASAK